MPIPKPNPQESRSDFVGRCMSTISDEFDDKDQRLGVCFSTWREARKDIAKQAYYDHLDDLVNYTDIENEDIDSSFSDDTETQWIDDWLNYDDPLDDRTSIPVQYYQPIIKIDSAKHFVLAPVLVPETVDLQDEIVSSEEIEKAAHGYLVHSRRTDLMHRIDIDESVAALVESYIVRTDTEINNTRVIKGTWLAGLEIRDPKLWSMIEAKTFTGLSIFGAARAEAEESAET